MELPFSRSTTCPQPELGMNLAQFPTLKELEITNCQKLSSLPPIPWTSSPCRALIKEVGSDFQRLDYSKNNQSEFCLLVKEKDGHLDSAFWRLLAFSNLTELKELALIKCPPLALEHLQMLSSLRRLTIENTNNVLSHVEAESTVRYQFPAEQLRIFGCNCSGREGRK
uniref:Uncharacterized protein n=1 Tax=Oryza brachyantha TaxID=4533 RepID=J3MHH2_ORYBR